MNKKAKVIRVLGIAVLVMLAVLLIAVIGGIIYVNSLLDLVDRNEITGNENLSANEIYGNEPTVDATTPDEEIKDIQDNFQNVQDKEILTGPDMENILLIGSDRHSNQENGRADSMMILSLNRKTGKIHIVSLMRAMFVCIPRSNGDTWYMLNAAYSWGGPKMLIDTVEKNFRVDIDHYVAVDFNSFTQIIDIVGGVDVPLTNGEARHLQLGDAGTYTLNGEQALNYTRIRHLDSDFARTGRQRTVIEALLKKARSLDVSTLIELANAILPAVNTDMTNAQLLEYMAQAPTLLSYPITQKMLPIENEDGSFRNQIYIDNLEMYRVDFAKNIEALHAFLED